MVEELPPTQGTKLRVYDRWLEALLPDPVEIGRSRLRPMTYGHAILLARLTGWEPLVNSFRVDDLPAALYILSRDWREAASSIGEPEAHEFLASLAKRTNLPECAAAWARYLAANLVLPRFHKIPTNAQATRSPGAPLLLRLRLFAFRNLGLSPDELEDFILADLVWLWLAHIEEEGSIRLLDDDDVEFEAWCRAEEAKMSKKEAPCP